MLFNWFILKLQYVLLKSDLSQPPTTPTKNKIARNSNNTLCNFDHDPFGNLTDAIRNKLGRWELLDASKRNW